jgi:hypothetical protein
LPGIERNVILHGRTIRVVEVDAFRAMQTGALLKSGRRPRPRHISNRVDRSALEVSISIVLTGGISQAVERAAIAEQESKAAVDARDKYRHK